MPAAKIGDRLRQAMNGMMQVELIRKAAPLLKERGMRLTKSKLSQYVNNINTPDGDMIELLAEVLGVDPAWLAGFTGDEKTAPEIGDGLEQKLSRLSPALLEQLDRFLELAQADPETAARFLSFAVQELESSQTKR